MATTNKNTEYLRFSAYSLKELLTRKLSQDTKFTDQIYDGSNMTVLIEIISYMYQCLTHLLNKGAGESMFSDTQIYENISRLVNLIGYNPKGCITPTCQFSFDNSGSDEEGAVVENFYGKCVLPYSAIDTDTVDSNGNRIYYSTVEPYYVNNDAQFAVQMVNGQWKMYNQVLVASGTAYDTFILDGLKSDSDDGKYVVWPYIDVYVRKYESATGKFNYTKWKYVTEGLFTDNNLENGSKIYTSTDKIYNLRLDENKVYQIKFGNGINGEMPEEGDEIIVFYLEGNGKEAEIEEINLISNKVMQHSASFFGISGTLYEKIFQDYINNTFTTEQLGNIKWSNTTSSTEFQPEETVEEIRTNAPNWFKMGNRLITQEDYVYYLKQRYKDNIIDIYTMNNWEYISIFYKWLYEIGRNARSDGRYYLNENNLIKYDYKYADACDSNNVYIWAKMKNDIDIYSETFKKEISNIKTLTAETVFVKPIDVNFMVSAKGLDELKELIKEQSVIYDSQTYIEILLSNTALYTNDIVQQKINNIIIDFFKESNFQLGMNVDYNDLLNSIYAVDGIERIRTVYEYTDDDGYTKYKIVNGLSFATWSNSLIRDGDDLEVSNTTRILEPFQFPVLFEQDLKSKIKVIKKNTNMINSVQY